VRTLKERLHDLPRAGSVVWIGVRPEHGAAVIELDEVLAIEGRGLDGDVVVRGKGGGARQVTLVQAEHLPVIAALAGVAAVSPAALRRNLLVAGLNLAALARTRFAIGEVVLVGTGPCAPCGYMDKAIGPLGFQATRGHGGITARVEKGGVISRGMSVRLLGSVSSK
jgi:MOSC domain-containing protein YiiM